ncbi:MAG: phosphoglycolate phosphatase [Gammaproteobacteria bacterium]|nr:MAG: phosphoglycolate phosphatase [Gammaproteobacteria bacterium]
MPPKLILIDVDGTMVDSVPDLSYCVDEMLKKLNLPIRGEEKVRLWVGNGVEKLVQRALTCELEPAHLDEILFQKAMPIFNELYQNNIAKKSVLYDGVLKTLQELKHQKIPLGCVTNKAQRFTLPLLKNLKIDNFFDMILCGDELEHKKPHPAPLLHMAKFFNIKPTDSLLIGDSQSDVKAARAAGFKIICVSYGYNHGKNIKLSKPDKVVDSMTEINFNL